MPRTFYNPQNYAEELSLHPELGLALFHPGMDNPIAIGDVGFIHEGKFKRFFNTFCPPTDPINVAGTPAGFEPVPLVNRCVNCDDAYSPGVFGSKGVTKLRLDLGMGMALLFAMYFD